MNSVFFKRLWYVFHTAKSINMPSTPESVVIRVDLAKLRALVRRRHLASTVIVWNEIDEKTKEYKEDEYDLTPDQHNELVARLKVYLVKHLVSAGTSTPLSSECHIFLDGSDLIASNA